MNKNNDVKKETIILVEDDQRLAVLMQEFLEEYGYHVIINDSGAELLCMVKDNNPSVIVLDINLPKSDGFTLCKELRPDFDGVIIFVTARDSDIDQIVGLEIGADDYVVKPVDPRVLLARIQALLRRLDRKRDIQTHDNKILKFGSLVINQASRDVIMDNSKIVLTNIEYELLNILAKRAGEIIERDALFHDLYGRAYDGLDRSIDVRISHLRRKLGDHANMPTRIKTIWGRGYLFVAEAW